MLLHPRRCCFEEWVSISENDPPKVIVVMRNSSCQQPHGFHLLRLTELCLQAPSSSNVFHNDFEVAERAILYAESPSAYTNDDDLAVFAFPIDFTPAHAPAGPVAVKNRPAIGWNLIEVTAQVPRQQFLF